MLVNHCQSIIIGVTCDKTRLENMHHPNMHKSIIIQFGTPLWHTQCHLQPLKKINKCYKLLDMYLSISHSFLDCFAWNMDQIQAISHVHTAAWPNDQSQPVITGYWLVIENFHNWKNRTDNFQKRQKPDWWSGHKSVQFGPVSVFFQFCDWTLKH